MLREPTANGKMRSVARGAGEKGDHDDAVIFGVHDVKVIFYEELVSRDYLLGKPNACVAIKSPKAVATRGYYPTVSCIRHDAATGGYAVSMEQFVLREASAPEWAPAPK